MPNKALLIGVDTFKEYDKIKPLHAVKDDIKALHDLLGKYGDFEPPIIALTGDITKDEVENAVYELFNDAGPDDLRLLYFSGHGFRLKKPNEDEHLYLALPGTRAQNPHIGSLSSVFIKDEIASSSSDKIAIILDCCNAGSFHPDGQYARNNEIAETKSDILENYTNRNGIFALVAAMAKQSAFEKEIEKADGTMKRVSMFTQYLVNGIKNGEASDEDEYLDLSHFEALAVKTARMNNLKGVSDPELLYLEGGPRDYFPIIKNPLPPLNSDWLKGIVSEDPDKRNANIGYIQDYVLEKPDSVRSQKYTEILKERLDKDKPKYETDIRNIKKIKETISQYEERRNQPSPEPIPLTSSISEPEQTTLFQEVQEANTPEKLKNLKIKIKIALKNDPTNVDALNAKSLLQKKLNSFSEESPESSIPAEPIRKNWPEIVTRSLSHQKFITALVALNLGLICISSFLLIYYFYYFDDFQEIPPIDSLEVISTPSAGTETGRQVLKLAIDEANKRIQETQDPKIIGEYWKAAGSSYDGNDRDESWNAAFISWLFKESGNSFDIALAPTHLQILESAIKKGLFRSPNAYTPVLGDLVVLVRGDETNPIKQIESGEAINPFKGTTGVILKIENKEITAIGGDISDSVNTFVRGIDDPKIIGYIHLQKPLSPLYCYNPAKFKKSIAHLEDPNKTLRTARYKLGECGPDAIKTLFFEFGNPALDSPYLHDLGISVALHTIISKNSDLISKADIPEDYEERLDRLTNKHNNATMNRWVKDVRKEITQLKHAQQHD